jgi:methionyl-tRNA formyltransferase
MSQIKKVLFVGSKQLGLNCLEAMYKISPETLLGVLTFDDSSDTRSKHTDFIEYCHSNEIPLFIAKNRADSEQIIESQKPDICIVVGWYWLVSNHILEQVPYGLLGIHNSVLPKYRGSAPLVWGMINNEKQLGFSMFTFTEGMDEGAIWFEHSFKLKKTDYIADVLQKLEKAAVAELNKHYLNIIQGKLNPKAQNHQEATYCAQRIPSDGIIDWTQSAKQVYNFIRAQSKPYPGAFTHYKNEKLIIWRAKIHKGTYYGTAGQVAQISSEGVFVICGDNKAIILEEVEYLDQTQNPKQILKSIKTRFE